MAAPIVFLHIPKVMDVSNTNGRCDHNRVQNTIHDEELVDTVVYMDTKIHGLIKPDRLA